MDPYLYENTSVMKNKLNIRNTAELEEAEANYVVFRIKEITMNPLKGDYSYAHFLKFHYFLFQDIYDWAGQPRKVNIEKHEPLLGEMSIEYADVFDVCSDATRVLEEMALRDWEGMSTESFSKVFAKDLADLWKVHCFREGNTRTTITFCLQFADEKGFKLNRNLFEKHSEYVRTALVAYNAYFSDGVNVSKKEYLENFIKDALT